MHIIKLIMISIVHILGWSGLGGDGLDESARDCPFLFGQAPGIYLCCHWTPRRLLRHKQGPWSVSNCTILRPEKIGDQDWWLHGEVSLACSNGQFLHRLFTILLWCRSFIPLSKTENFKEKVDDETLVYLLGLDHLRVNESELFKIIMR